MLKRVGSKKLGRKASHRRALVKNQLKSLFENGKVHTTTPKAKVLKSNAESLISSVTEMDLNTRRRLQGKLISSDALKNFETYMSAKDKAVKIVKVGFRAGDNAETSRVSLQGFSKAIGDAKKASEKKADK